MDIFMPILIMGALEIVSFYELKVLNENKEFTIPAALKDFIQSS